MSISDKILGKKPSGDSPRVDSVFPPAAIPGGELRITGAELKPHDLSRPRVRFGETEGAVVISSNDVVVARVPEEAGSQLVISNNGHSSSAVPVVIGELLADSMHPVTNPAVDANGNVFTTVSGTRGQKVPVSVYSVDPNGRSRAFLADVMNASGLAFNHAGELFVSSRYEGSVYRVNERAEKKVFAESMGIATGIAFDAEGSLYVGDRSGTIFKISRKGETFVFATLEPSVSAYHLAFSPDGDLYVAGPTTSSFDAVYRVNPRGEVAEWFRGLGRPQGMAFDMRGNLYVAASYAGKRGIIRITPDLKPSLAIAGPHMVGIAFGPAKTAFVTTINAVYRLELGIEGMPLFG
jgi:sugar lactone lactonase YvrE